MDIQKVKVLELFSGIGGMHYSLGRAKKVLNEIYETNDVRISGTDELRRFDFEVVSAVDISEVANRVYRHNFPGVNHGSANVCGIKPEALEKKGVEAIFMSPPCQPFTRQGLQKDLGDNRTQPLVHLATNVIPNLRSLKYVLVENVKGFETSESRNLLVKSLTEADFSVQEFLLNPVDIGIPNSRLRYYLIGKKKPEKFEFETRDEIATSFELKFVSEIGEKFRLGTKKTLADFLSNLTEQEQNLFAVPDKVLGKHCSILDIVQPDSGNSCCFTKAYTKYAEGTGSVIQQDGDLREVFERVQGFLPKKSSRTKPDQDPEKQEDHRNVLLSNLRQLKLRYFTPTEIAKLLGFPVEVGPGETGFEFPPDLPANSPAAYRVLGNSLSVTTVSFLATLLFLKL